MTSRTGTTAGPASAAEGGTSSSSFSPARTAVLVIDPVNDFLSEGGAAWDLTRTTVQKNDVVRNLKRLIEGARQRGIPVLFGPMAYTEEDYADERWQRRSGINRIMFERKMFLAGSWGGRLSSRTAAAGRRDRAPAAQGHRCLRNRPTGAPAAARDRAAGDRRDDREPVLRVDRPARDGARYDVTFIWDAIGAENMPAYEASIRVNYPLIANAVMSVDEFLAAADPREAAAAGVQPGDTVLGSDHGEVGRVERIERAGDGGGFFVVPRGIVFEKDTYIPIDAIVKRSGTTVFINVPKLVIGYMPWDVPPSAETQQAKRGPRRADVARLYGSRSPSGSGGGAT